MMLDHLFTFGAALKLGDSHQLLNLGAHDFFLVLQIQMDRDIVGFVLGLLVNILNVDLVELSGFELLGGRFSNDVEKLDPYRVARLVRFKVVTADFDR